MIDRGAVLRILFIVFARGDLFEGCAGDVFGICEPDVRAADVRIGIVEAVDGRDVALGIVEDDVAFVLAVHVDDGPAFDATYREPVLLVRQRLAVGVVAFIAGEVAFECQRGFGVVRPGLGVGQFVGVVDFELAERPVGRGEFLEHGADLRHAVGVGSLDRAGAGKLRQRSEDVGLELFLDVVVEEFVGVFYGQRCREYDDPCRAGVALVDLRADGEAPVHDHQVVVPGILRDRDPFGVGFVAAQAGIAPTIRDFGDDVDPRTPDALDRTACGAGRPVAVHAVVDLGCGVELEFLIERDIENVAAGGDRDRNLDLRVEVVLVDEHQLVLRPVERVGRRVALDADLDFRAGFPDRHRRGGYPLRQLVDRPVVVGLDQDRHREIGASLGPGQVDAFGLPFVIGVGEAGFAAAVFEVAVLVELACAEAEAAFERTACDRGDDLALAAHLEGYLADTRVVELIEFGHADYDPRCARTAAQRPDFLCFVLYPEPCGGSRRDTHLPVLVGLYLERVGAAGFDGRRNRLGEVGAGELRILIRIGTRSGRQTCSGEQRHHQV